MAKKRSGRLAVEVIDRVLFVAIICMAIAYLMQGTWTGAFAEAGGFAAGIVWSYRAIMTNPNRIFRLMAALVLALLGMLLAFYLAAGQGLA